MEGKQTDVVASADTGQLWWRDTGGRYVPPTYAMDRDVLHGGECAGEGA